MVLLKYFQRNWNFSWQAYSPIQVTIATNFVFIESQILATGWVVFTCHRYQI